MAALTTGSTRRQTSSERSLGEKRLIVPLTDASARSGSPPAQCIARLSARKLSRSRVSRSCALAEVTRHVSSATPWLLWPSPCRSSSSACTSVQTTSAARFGACRFPCVDTVRSSGALRGFPRPSRPDRWSLGSSTIYSADRSCGGGLGTDSFVQCFHQGTRCPGPESYASVTQRSARRPGSPPTMSRWIRGSTRPAHNVETRAGFVSQGLPGQWD